jgi:hypothetical protein
MIADELGRGDAGSALSVVSGAYAAIIVGRCGTADQRAQLAPSGGGRRSPRGSILYFEGYGRSPFELEAVVTGPGPAGHKVGVVRAVEVDFGVAVGQAADGLRASLLGGDQLRLGVGRATEQIGARAASLSTVDLAACGAGQQLDPEREAELHRCIAGMRLALASISIGVARTALRYAAEYAAERQAFGRPIANFQGVSFPLVDCEMAIDAARLAVSDVAAGIDGSEDARRLADEVAVAVAAAGQVGAATTAAAVNTLGGHGYLTDHPVERWYRDAVVLAALDFDPLLSDWSAVR